MTFHVVSLFAELFENLGGLLEQARQKNLITLNLVNPRQFTQDVHQSVDGSPYGGRPGMLMQFEPLHKSIQHLKKQHKNIGPVVLLSPQGQKWSHTKAQQWAQQHTHLTLVCARYAGVDERFIHTCVDQQVSIGDYILTGGELPALVLMDSMARFIKGVLGNHDSNATDSFSQGLLQEPQFTRPSCVEWAGKKLTVPAVLRSGHKARVNEWQHNMSLLKTWLLRPDLLSLNKEQKQKLLHWLREQPDEDLQACGLKSLRLE